MQCRDSLGSSTQTCALQKAYKIIKQTHISFILRVRVEPYLTEQRKLSAAKFNLKQALKST